MIPRESLVWRCSHCNSLFIDGTFNHPEYRVCPNCSVLCHWSSAIGGVRSFDSKQIDKLPYGIEPSEADLLYAIESHNYKFISGRLTEKEFYYSEQNTLEVLQLNAYKEGIKNEAKGLFPELLSKRKANARLLASVCENSFFLCDIYKYLEEYEKCLSVFQAIPVSNWHQYNNESYLAVKKLVYPNTDIDAERLAFTKNKEDQARALDLLQIHWDNELAKVEASTTYEKVVESIAILFYIVSLIATIYIFFKISWVAAVIFGFVSFKVSAFVESISTDKKVYRSIDWKKRNPKPKQS